MPKKRTPEGRRAQVAEVVAFTGCPDDEAKRCLIAADWSVEDAVRLLATHTHTHTRQPQTKQVELVYDEMEEDDSDYDDDQAFPVTCSAREQSDVSKLKAWYASLPSDGADSLSVEGVLQFCQQCGMDPESDPALLVVGFVMGCTKMLRMTEEEFVVGTSTLRVETPLEMKALLPQLRELLKTNSQVRKDVYDWCFGWAIAVGQKTMSPDTAVALWPLLLDVEFFPLLNEYVEFFKLKHPRAVTKDEWSLTYEFAPASASILEVDEDSAWPVIIDSFVESRATAN